MVTHLLFFFLPGHFSNHFFITLMSSRVAADVGQHLDMTCVTFCFLQYFLQSGAVHSDPNGSGDQLQIMFWK